MCLLVHCPFTMAAVKVLPHTPLEYQMYNCCWFSLFCHIKSSSIFYPSDKSCIIQYKWVKMITIIYNNYHYEHLHSLNSHSPQFLDMLKKTCCILWATCIKQSLDVSAHLSRHNVHCSPHITFWSFIYGSQWTVFECKASSMLNIHKPQQGGRRFKWGFAARKAISSGTDNKIHL